MMRRGIVAFTFFLFTTCTFASWQIIGSRHNDPLIPIFTKDTPTSQSFPIKIATNTTSSANISPNNSQLSTLPVPAPTPVPRKPDLATSDTQPGIYALTVSGSIKQNLERVMTGYKWKVVWKAPYDYRFDGSIRGASLPDVIEKLLKPYPLKGVMFMSNRTLEVIPRDQADAQRDAHG